MAGIIKHVFFYPCALVITGMSTAYEVIVACHSEMTVFAFSLITNKCVTSYEQAMANHEEVMQAGRDNENILQEFVSRIVLHIAQILYPAQNDDDDDDDAAAAATAAVAAATAAAAVFVAAAADDDDDDDEWRREIENLI